MSMKKALILMRRYGNLLLCSLVLGATLAAVNGHAASALIKVDPRELLQALSPPNVLVPEATGKPGAADKKATVSDSRASSSRAVAPSSSKQAPAGNSIYGGGSSLQQPVGELAPVPIIDTSPLPYSTLSRELLAEPSTAMPIGTAGGFSMPVFAASSQGWTITGIAWYWWLAALVSVAVVGHWSFRHFRKLLA